MTWLGKQSLGRSSNVKSTDTKSALVAALKVLRESLTAQNFLEFLVKMPTERRADDRR
jgi:hypothetical protein